MDPSNHSARNARLIFIVGVVGAAVVTASACSLTNLDPYTAVGGAVDTGVRDSTVDVTSDTRPDSAKLDEGVDTAVPGDTAVEDTTLVDGDATAGDAGDATDGDAAVTDGADAADVADTRDAAVAETTADTPASSDTGVDPDAPCGSGVGRFGVSEFMPRAVAGTGDKHEWVELTNYDTCTIDVSGVTIKVSSTVDRASFTFPAGTTLTAGEAVVVVDDSATFTADIATTGFVPGKVFSFGSTTGDVIVNSTAYFRLYAPGATVPYEDVTANSPSSGWLVNRSMAYPPPSGTCPTSARFSSPSGGTLGAAWKPTPVDPLYKYGETGSPAAGLYGTPTKTNTGITCP